MNAWANALFPKATTLERLIDSYVVAAGVARDVGFQFVDIKACHGYLLHEFLSARSRPGRFGGDLEGRTRLLFTIIHRIREAFPDLHVMVRLSIFDTLPYKTSRDVGEPMRYEHLLPYRFGFGAREDDPLQYDLAEGIELLRRLFIRSTARYFHPITASLALSCENRSAWSLSSRHGTSPGPRRSTKS